MIPMKSRSKLATILFIIVTVFINSVSKINIHAEEISDLQISMTLPTEGEIVSTIKESISTDPSVTISKIKISPSTTTNQALSGSVVFEGNKDYDIRVYLGDDVTVADGATITVNGVPATYDANAKCLLYTYHVDPIENNPLMENLFTISFDPNGATSGSMETVRVRRGMPYEIERCEYVKDGYWFEGSVLQKEIGGVVSGALPAEIPWPKTATFMITETGIDINGAFIVDMDSLVLKSEWEKIDIKEQQNISHEEGLVSYYGEVKDKSTGNSWTGRASGLRSIEKAKQDVVNWVMEIVGDNDYKVLEDSVGEGKRDPAIMRTEKRVGVTNGNLEPDTQSILRKSMIITYGPVKVVGYRVEFWSEDPAITNTAITAISNGEASLSEDGHIVVTIEEGEAVTLTDKVEFTNVNLPGASEVECTIYKPDGTKVNDATTVRLLRNNFNDGFIDVEIDYPITEAGIYTVYTRMLETNGTLIATHNDTYDIPSETVEVIVKEKVIETPKTTPTPTPTSTPKVVVKTTSNRVEVPNTKDPYLLENHMIVLGGMIVIIGTLLKIQRKIRNS